MWSPQNIKIEDSERRPDIAEKLLCENAIVNDSYHMLGHQNNLGAGELQYYELSPSLSTHTSHGTLQLHVKYLSAYSNDSDLNTVPCIDTDATMND